MRGLSVSTRISANAHVLEHLGPEPELAEPGLARTQPGAHVGGVACAVEQQLVANLVRLAGEDVQEHAAADLVDPGERRSQARSGVVAEPEHVADGLRALGPEHDRRLAVEGPLAQGHELRDRSDQRAEAADRPPVGLANAEHRRHERSRGDLLDQRLALESVLDQIGDRDDRQAVLASEQLEVVHPRHLTVVAHDLADDPGRGAPSQAGEIDGALGVTRADQDAAGLGPEREDVAGADDVVGAKLGIGGDPDGLGPIGGGDARGHPRPGLDRDRERGAHAPGIGRDHHPQAELSDPRGGQRQTDQPAAMLGHEVDRVGVAVLGRDHEVTLVLTILIVDHDHHATATSHLDRTLDSLEWIVHVGSFTWGETCWEGACNSRST